MERGLALGWGLWALALGAWAPEAQAIRRRVPLPVASPAVQGQAAPEPSATAPSAPDLSASSPEERNAFYAGDPLASGPWRGGWIGPELLEEEEGFAPALDAALALRPARVGEMAMEGPATGAQAPSGRSGRLTILYTGFTGGLGEGQVAFEELAPFADPQATVAGGGFADLGAFRQGPLLAFKPEGDFKRLELQAFLAAKPIRLRRAESVALVETDHAFVLPGAMPEPRGEAWLGPWLAQALREKGGFPDARLRRAGRFIATNAKGDRLVIVSLDGRAPGVARFARAEAWERAAAGALMASPKGDRALKVLAVGRPIGEGARRAALLRSWAAKGGGQLLRVDLGNALEAGGTASAEAQREASLQALGGLGYDLMVPGERELSLSQPDWGRLRASVGDLVAANLSTKADGWATPSPWVRRRLGGLDVGVVGLVDDRALRQAGLVGPGMVWQASDAEAAARQAIASARTAGCEVVVLATHLRAERLHALRLLVGSTVVLAEFQGLPGERFEERVQVGGAARPRAASALLVASSSPARVGRLTLAWEKGPTNRVQVVSLSSEAQLVTDALPADPALSRERERLEEAAREAGRAVVLPDARAIAQAGAEAGLALPDRWTEASWGLVVAKALRLATQAEVAVVGVRPIAARPPGPIDRHALELRWLPSHDQVIAMDLPGSALKALAKAAQGAWLFAGYDAGSHSIDGRPVVDAERYRVSLPASLGAQEAWVEALGSGHRLTAWEPVEGGGWRVGAQGKALGLAPAVLAALGAWGQAMGGPEGPDFARAIAFAIAKPSNPSEAAPRLVMRLDELQLNGTRVATQGTDAYGAVRNTRVTAPSSWALGLKGRASAGFEAGPWAWEGRLRSAYRRVAIQALNKPEEVQEAEDEITLTGEARRFLWGHSGPSAFLNSSVVTEFVPDLNKPRRLEVNGVTGLASGPWGGFSQLRLGAVVKNDLANPNRLEPGLRLEAQGLWPLSPWALPGSFKLNLEATRYMLVPGDGPDRLGSLVNAVGTYALPLWDHLRLELVADALAFQGKGATDPWGSNLELRVGLGMDLGYKPLVGLWF